MGGDRGEREDIHPGNLYSAVLLWSICCLLSLDIVSKEDIHKSSIFSHGALMFLLSVHIKRVIMAVV